MRPLLIYFIIYKSYVLGMTGVQPKLKPDSFASSFGADYECAYGHCIKFTVTEAAVKVNDQIRWKASSENITETEFLITEGFEHYGPRIYSEPAYGQIKKPLDA